VARGRRLRRPARRRHRLGRDRDHAGKEVGDREAFERIRLRNLELQQERYQAGRTWPEEFKKPLFEAIEEIVGREVREKHFTPSYQPWDQRLCVVPNGDLFHAIVEGRAEVVTGHIETWWRRRGDLLLARTDRPGELPTLAPPARGWRPDL
jgi:cation diffusion facilitator CzcD-associated flavoprotein CzcO